MRMQKVSKGFNLETQRCWLSASQEADARAIMALSTDADVRRFLGGPLSADRARVRADGIVSGRAGGKYWVVCLHENPVRACIGLVHVGPHHDGQDDELAYEFSKEVWGRGIAFEAVQAVINSAFSALGYSRLVSETQVKNLASRRLLERVGMQPEKMLTRFGEDQILYAISRDGDVQGVFEIS